MHNAAGDTSAEATVSSVDASLQSKRDGWLSPKIARSQQLCGPEHSDL